MNYTSTSNIRKVIKFYNLGDKTYETDFSCVEKRTFFVNSSPSPSDVALFNIVAWSARLKNCPLQDKDWFLKGITNGLDIVCCPNSLSSSKKNMPSAYQHPEIIDNYLKEKIGYVVLLVGLTRLLSKTFILIGLGLFLSLRQLSGV